MVGATARRTATDNDRLSILSEVGCIPCMIDGWWSPGEIHHVVEGMVRLENQHRWTYPACAWHHRGVPPGDCTAHFGPSMALSPRDYRHRYGEERGLVYIADAVVRIVESANRHHEWLSDVKMTQIVEALFGEIVLEESPTPEGAQKLS